MWVEERKRAENLKLSGLFYSCSFAAFTVSLTDSQELNFGVKGPYPHVSLMKRKQAEGK